MTPYLLEIANPRKKSRMIAILIFGAILVIFSPFILSSPSDMGQVASGQAKILRWNVDGPIRWSRQHFIIEGCNSTPQDLEMEERHALSLEPRLLSPEDPITKEVDRILQRILAVCKFGHY
jgi:hypothetical protein